MKQRLLSIFIAAALALAFVVRPVHADEARDREKLVATAGQTLDKMVAEIKGFDKDANAQDSVDAVRLSIELGKVIADLKAIQGTDKQALDMVNTWPDHIKGFQAAAVRLAKLKNLQLTVQGDYPKECKNEQKRLDDVIQQYLPRLDPDGMTEIPKTGRNVGATASAMITNATGADKMAQITVREATGFGARGEWSPLTSALHDAAKGMAGDIADKLKAIETSCTQLAKGDKNPDVLNARKKIADATGSELNKLQVMVDDWEEKAAGYFKTDCTAMKRMADAYCGVDAGDEDAQSEVDRLANEVDVILRDVRAANKDLDDELAAIRKSAAHLQAEAKTKGEADNILKEMDDELKKIAALQSDGAMAGFRHPSVQFYIKFGKQMHDRMEASYSCDVRDTAYEGSRERPDCVRAKSCVIFEFKPDSPGAKSKGVGQLKTYKELVEKYYNKVLDGKATINSKYGGAAIMQAFEKSGCIKSGKLTMDTKLATYNRCEVKYQCTN